MNIDLNCDLGEGAGYDDELLGLVTTANVCCGAHAGDPMTMLQTVGLAMQQHVRVGAHPGYADKKYFGRRELELPLEQVYVECVYQIGGLRGIVETGGGELTHLKPHGALYNQACKSEMLSQLLVIIAKQFKLAILALPNSELERAAAGTVRFVREGFADRRYNDDGSLVPRSKRNAVIYDAKDAVKQAEWLIREHKVRSLCVHGDNPKAIKLVKSLRKGLTTSGYTIRPFA